MGAASLTDRDEIWDETWDVVVVGCGYAGAMAAVAAHDAGARVLVLEKEAEPGGISVCAAGGVRVAEDAGRALAYLVETNAGRTPEAVLRRLADGMAALPAEIERLAEGQGARIGRRPSPANYPLAGYETFGFVYVDALEGFDAAETYPNVRGSAEGARLFRLLERNLESRGIPLRLSTPAERLVIGAKGEVLGVRAGGRHLRAHGGVVLACGGFEGAPEMQAQYWQAQPVLNAAFRGNTGDGIRMAQEAGADLWHMWHYHGSYGFRHPDPAYPYGIRTKRVPDWRPGEAPPASDRGEVRMPWILLDRAGRRFMNEYDPYLQDTGARPFDRFDPLTQRFSALPAILLADEAGRRLYPFGRPTWHEAGIGYEWSADNEAEIAIGLLRRADSLDALAEAAGLPPARVRDAVERWNRACEAAVDEDHGRPPTSMMPIVEPPFVFAEVWPIVSNTQGGPVHDARQRVLTSFGEPIPGLYAAGECGSVFGYLYMSGGNIAECFVGGDVAGKEAAGRAAEGAG